MAKQKQKKEEQGVTRKEHARRRRDAERTRRLLIGLGAAAGLVLVLLILAVLSTVLTVSTANGLHVWTKSGAPVASVNGSDITVQDYAKAVKLYWMQEMQQGGQAGQNPLQDGQQVLSQMEDQQLILAQAHQRAITVSQSDVDQAIQHNFGYYSTPPTPTPTPSESPTPTPTDTPMPTGGPGTPSPTVAPAATPAPTATPVSLQSYQSMYKQYLTTLQQQTGMTEADFRKMVETDLYQQKLYDQIIASVPTKGEEVHARHILVSVITPAPTEAPAPTGQPTYTPTPQPTPGGPTPVPTQAPRDDAQALARAQMVEQKLKVGGDFAALAKQYSDDTGSAQNGGDLGWFARGEMVTEFETAAFSATVGTITAPVKTQYGYHIIQVLAKDPQHTLDANTLQQNQLTAWQDWLSQQRSAAKIVSSWTADMIPPTPQAATTQ